ncbi:hypothetical protein SAY87_008156 [Trapa incisa]|uniref:B box-type domain-containing protein n=1 Tax=Trapa incisa TaxID=236973 RepID=A0AAN7KJV0_9MYRT|nr:hypothetical protein SAY87_008156 [Trapa incisa]
MRGCVLCKVVPAKTFCDSDQAALCWDCDAKVHGANFLVARHSRTLLCHACQRLTPWTASGAKLGHTVSDGGDGGGGGSSSDGGRDEDGDNQVVPWSSLTHPPAASSSSDDESVSQLYMSNKRGTARTPCSTKRMREGSSPDSRWQEDLGDSSSRRNRGPKWLMVIALGSLPSTSSSMANEARLNCFPFVSFARIFLNLSWPAVTSSHGA